MGVTKNYFYPLTYYIFIFLSVTISIVLSSCSHVAKKDGPPNFYVDESRIPNAIPKAEPLARYGNMKTYWVFGKPYKVMKACHNYEEVGTASWYGTKFHARRTSSGERYNMLAMTAAHRYLPLPTYVEVTNLKNNKKVIVKVNDRGPFASNRIIDLSYVAAKKLDMLGRGTTRVKVRAINPVMYGGTAVAQTTTHKRFAWSLPTARQKVYKSQTYLQVGAFQHKQNAEQLKNKLGTLFKTPVKISTPSFKEKLYRVQIGPINDLATVNKITTKLKGLGISPI